MNINEKCEKTVTELGFDKNGLFKEIKQYCKAGDMQRTKK